MWEFLLPSNSNAKNRNDIFLWFLACFIISMTIAFWNGYQIGKCNCTGSNLSLPSDTIQIRDLKAENERLEKDSTSIRNDINQLISSIKYDSIKNLNTPIELNTYSVNLSNLNVRDASLQNIKLVVADIIKYKSDVISNLNDYIESQKSVRDSLTEVLAEKYRELRRVNKKIEDKKNN